MPATMPVLLLLLPFWPLLLLLLPVLLLTLLGELPGMLADCTPSVPSAGVKVRVGVWSYKSEGRAGPSLQQLLCKMQERGEHVPL